MIRMHNFYLILLFTFFLFGCTTDKKSSEFAIKDELESKIDSILSNMSLEEKIGQTAQRGKSSRVKELPLELKEAVKKGHIGSFLNIMNKEDAKELQRIAVEESPNKIPLIFARDVIHGFKTIFPIPLGQAATFNPEIVEQGSRIAAIEASTYGIRWTFAPMIDISRDPRWGRIAESSGEDPYLTSILAKAYIKGFQGDDLSSAQSLAACAKHFIGYGAAEGGRDYNTANINDHLLHNVYLKPFKAAVDAGSATFMTSFNDLNGIPASANKYILKDILRDEWGFDGFVVSDWNSIIEMVNHGYAKDEKEAAEKAANAMLDMEMTSTSYQDHMMSLIKEGKFLEEQLDQMVRNILRIKFRLGLFKEPYFDPDSELLYAKRHLSAAKEAALQSTVLLKNQNNILPITTDKKIAIVGPLANAPHEQLGTWTFDGEKEHTITPLHAFGSDKQYKFEYSKGVSYSRDTSENGFDDAIRIAKTSDVILFFAGEEAILSGEAHSRANIDLPGVQEKLISELYKTGKPIVLVIMAGRPITLNNIIDKVDGIIMAWHPGTMGGPALKDILTGKISPSGKLPITWPKEVGQIPIHYNHKNTGRPVIPDEYVGIDSIPIGAWQSSLGNTSHYLDIGYLPQYPFGYGLTYSNFEYSEISISNNTPKIDDTISIKTKITNTGGVKATEVVQLYFRDVVGSLTRPIKELLRFERVTLEPGNSKEIEFIFTTEDLSFYGPDKKWIIEPGDFRFWIAKHAHDESNEIQITLE
ncbi:glycoside hydrolase family 3 N-terminal domain-containing protein [Aquimarina sp. 2201CG5-10]|uniref:glycoside hydrolase family 3 N-terminal domain-containing protein n=1 Tax=Aquimarina callyspongiae TaxID=3098150 RepID=UPI002AB4B661|nr:glycoside hydrolase family 3 N-terminal domain-containing protein [Aquimarina sp. 2201CG5-10]MDY8135784.1 glycoside hydrolase family 3 N-terminal domain-containing protein [Aquimarina sp. 2201CG5-10]